MLGSCSALPRKSGHVSNTPVHMLLVAVVACQNPSQVGGGALSGVITKQKTKLTKIVEYLTWIFKITTIITLLKEMIS